MPARMSRAEPAAPPGAPVPAHRLPGPLRAVRAALFRRLAGAEDPDHLVRYAMYRALAEAAAGIPTPASVLSVSRSDHLVRAVGWSGAPLTAVDFPAVSLLDLPYRDGSFGALVADQVLEHIVGDPVEAVAESARVLA